MEREGKQRGGEGEGQLEGGVCAKRAASNSLGSQCSPLARLRSLSSNCHPTYPTTDAGNV